MTQTVTTSSATTDGRGVGARASAAITRIRRSLAGSNDRAVDRANAFIAFGVRVASAGILFVSQIALARWMGAEQYGIYVYVWTLVLVLGAISTLGLNIGAIRIVSELRERNRLDELRAFLLGGRIAVVLAAVALMALAATVALVIERSGAAGPWHTLAIIMLALPAYALCDVQDGICRGCGRIVSALIAPYIIRPLLILAGIGSLHMLGLPLDASYAAIIAVAATWIAWGMQSLIVARDLKRIAPVGPRSYRTREWIGVASPLMVMGLADLGMQNIDVIAISNLLSPTDAGIYFAGAKTMALILFVHYAVGSAMANRFSALAARGDKDGLQSAVRDAVRWTFWPSLGLAALMLGLGPHLLALFGEKFVAGYPVMGILAVAVVARAAIGPAESLLNMTGGQRDCARSLIIAAATNLLLNLVLIPRYGIAGAASAVSIAMVLGAILNWLAAKRNLGIDIGVWARAKAG